MPRSLVIHALLLISAPWALPAELEKELATDGGWRRAKWGMSVAELAQTLGKDFQEEKRSSKIKDAKVAIRGKSKTKLTLDELEYEVKFGFNLADRLNSVVLVCAKAKKETADDVRQRLTELFGGAHSQGRGYGRVGFAIVPDISEQTTWRHDLRRIELQTLQIRPNIFMWIHRLAIEVVKEESEAAFSDRGLQRFWGEIRDIGSRKLRWCSLEVNPLQEVLRVNCGKGETLIDQPLTAEDSLQAGERTPIGELVVQDLTIQLKSRPDPVKLSVATDVITLLQKSFPTRMK